MADKETRAKVIGEIVNRDGAVVPSVLVEDSKPKDAPLHDEFEWRDKVAAVEHRLSQARRIIRVTRVVAEGAGEPERLIHVPAIKEDSAGREGRYVPLSAVVESASDYELALRELMSKLAGLASAIDELKSAATGTQSDLLPTLIDSMTVAKRTLELMMSAA